MERFWGAPDKPLRSKEQRSFNPWKHMECIPLQKYAMGSRVMFQDKLATPFQVISRLGSGEYYEDGNDRITGWLYGLLFEDGSTLSWVDEEDIQCHVYPDTEGVKLLNRVFEARDAQYKIRNYGPFALNCHTMLDAILDDDFIPKGEDPRSYKATETVRQRILKIDGIKKITRAPDLVKEDEIILRQI